MNKIKTVGISASKSGKFIHKFFLKLSVRLAGAKPIILKHDEPEVLDTCDAFIIGGGTNVNPKVYGEKPETVEDKRPWRVRFFEKIWYPTVGFGVTDGSSVSHAYDDSRDKFEIELIKSADVHKKKILGICRGHQLINACSGGKLTQSLLPVLKNQMQIQSPLPRKPIKVVKGTLLHKVTESNEFLVNSLHAQFVSKLGKDLVASSHDAKGLIQSCENSTKRLIGCQWHPEYMIHKPVRKRLFKWLVS